jgi:hypothetical protein
MALMWSLRLYHNAPLKNICMILFPCELLSVSKTNIRLYGVKKDGDKGKETSQVLNSVKATLFRTN